MIRSVHEIIRVAENSYLTGNTKLGKYVDWSMHDTIETIDAYLNSKHTTGLTDSLGREKPFFNIVTAAVNIWYRATDIDRKDIRIVPDKITNQALAFLATVHLQEWMKKARFGVFLNQWGRALARYGSAVVKFVEKDGELTATVVPWNRFIADSVDFDAIPRIEKFYMTPAQLKKCKEYDQDAVDNLLQAVSTRKTLDHASQDTQSDFIEIYEVHGELEAELLSDDPDFAAEDDKFIQQMHVISYVEDGEDYKDFCLYKGKERRDPYVITHLIEEDGRTLSIGAVEYLLDAQWMQNHTVKNMKDTLDLTSKLIFQTADSNYAGRNVLSAIETGDILKHAENQPLTQLNNSKVDIVSLQNFGAMWRGLGQEITNTPDITRGITQAQPLTYGLGQIINNNSNSLFEIMTENKGLAIEDMMREFVILFLIKKMDTKDEIVSTFDEQGLAEVDSMYVPAEAARRFNSEVVEKTIQYLETNDPQSIPSPYQKDVAQQEVRDSLAPLGNKRAFKPSDIDTVTWKDALKDFEWKVNVEVTNEAVDKQAVLQTLTTALQTIATNPMILQDPNAKMLFSAILTETGRISPIQIVPAPAAAPPTVALPTNAQ